MIGLVQVLREYPVHNFDDTMRYIYNLTQIPVQKKD